MMITKIFTGKVREDRSNKALESIGANWEKHLDDGDFTPEETRNEVKDRIYIKRPPEADAEPQVLNVTGLTPMNANLSAKFNGRVTRYRRLDKIPFDKPDSKDKLTRCISRMAQSETGRALLDTAAEYGVRVALKDNHIYYGDFDRETKKVTIEGKSSDGALIEILAHELRHGWQDRHGFDSSFELPPSDNVIINRLIEADAEAVANQVAWELKEQGYNKPWLHAIRNKSYQDVAQAYRKEAEADPDAVRDGRALRAAFDQWFKKPTRRHGYDDMMLDVLEDWFEEYEENMNGKPQKLGKEWIDLLCTLPGGLKYQRGEVGKVMDNPYAVSKVNKKNAARIKKLEKNLGLECKGNTCKVKKPKPSLKAA